jgi:hypothetical protein
MLHPLRNIAIVAAVITVGFLYCTIATGELSGSVCDGKYSLFSENPYCRTPRILAIGFFISLAVTVILTVILIVQFVRERRRQRAG